MRATVSKGVDGYKAAFEAQRAADIAKIRPADVNGYKISLPKAFEGKMQIHVGQIDATKLDPKIQHYALDAKDPLLGWWKETAFKQGLGQEAFEEGLGAFAVSMDARRPDYAAELKLLGDNGKVRIDAARAWLKGNTSETTFKLFERAASTAAGVAAIEELIQKAGGPRLSDSPPPATPIEENFTAEQLRQMQGDPRYWDAGRRDEAFVAKVRAGWAKLKPDTQKAGANKGTKAA